ncbi:MAG: outer membrane lipoprotein carrier protein LolA [Candidatus Dadabacteria bacterium]|nr:MAG: outer membrane lipoprotein carrier protein LolA [Candidatus Dadabacteria bacterium]
MRGRAPHWRLPAACVLGGLVLLAASVAGAVARADPVDDVWAAYEARWNATRSLVASFRQRIDVDGIGGKVESAGRFYFAKPDRMRWDYVEGQQQSVVGDGRWIWVYQPDLEQVYRVSYETAFGRGGLVALLAGRQALAERYRLELVARDEREVTIRLTPKADVGEILEVTLAAGSFDLLRLAVRDPAGSTTYVEFSDLRRNVDLASSLFSFTPPEGVDVITTPAQP